MERRHFLSDVGKLALAAAASRWAPPVGAATPPPLTLAAVGDCLITRGFNRADSRFQPLLTILRSASVTFGNFEMTLPDPGMYPAATGACGDLNNSAEGPIPEEMSWAGFKMVGMANNHALDYGIEGMFATSRKVGAAGIIHAGTGRNLEDAGAPVYYDSPAGRVALIACASTFRPSSSASGGNGEIPGRPGLNPLRFRTTYRIAGAQVEVLREIQQGLFPGGRRGLVEAPKAEGLDFLSYQFVPGSPAGVVTTPDSRDMENIIGSVRRARRNADLVLVSIHAHEADGKREMPANFLPTFAHACIDAGAGAFIGHGPHVLRGMELYKRKPIFYSLGNFIFEAESMRQIPKEIYETCGIAGDDPSDFFDRAMKGFADSAYWESVVAQARFEQGELSDVKLFPVVLQAEAPRAGRGLPIQADGAQSRAILQRLSKLSEPFGTRITEESGVGIVRP